MRVVAQRVSEASVLIKGRVVSQIEIGLLILLGIEASDTLDDIDYLVKKLNQLRIFSDSDGKMNCSIQEVEGCFLVVSQFTLHASTNKGNRPSFIRASAPEKAEELYILFMKELEEFAEVPVQRGVFGADMAVDMVNSGPVTLILDSKDKSF
ncbi:MAG: D-aminoacyl-tRNA deacylase [Crocinitomicaceae bacterium]|nr:D-aminoacyl-tRNA deacylase [Crocinitomicaceae bacterium]